MPSVLDSFVIEIGLDPSKFTQGQKALYDSLKQSQQQALSVAGTIESSGKRMENFLTGVKREAIGFLALFLGGRGLKEFVSYLTTFDAAVGRSARTLDMSTGELSAWQNIARQTGGTAEGMTGAMQGLTDMIQKFMLTGQGDFLPLLNQLGVSLLDNNGHIKTASQLFLDLIAAVQGMDPARARALLLGLGIPGDVINTMLIGRQKIDELRAAQAELGNVTKEDAEAAQELQTAWAQAEQSATSFGRSILTGLTPALVGALHAMRDLFTWLMAGSKAPSFAGGANDVSGVGYVPGMQGDSASSTGGSGGGGWVTGKWMNFLSGLSYLETSQKGGGNTGSSAEGFFQFLGGTAAKAKRAGIADPRYGSWAAQAQATMAYIKKFYPAAASAIERGDFSSAIGMLRGEWPSLPGGSQPQSKSRYATFAQELEGGGPRPFVNSSGIAAAGGGGATTQSTSKTVNVTVGTVTTQAKDADSLGRQLGPALDRAASAGDFNYGLQ
jgi:hypothetical protein